MEEGLLSERVINEERNVVLAGGTEDELNFELGKPISSLS